METSPFAASRHAFSPGRYAERGAACATATPIRPAAARIAGVRMLYLRMLSVLRARGAR
jgi:hypothetical protein